MNRRHRTHAHLGLAAWALAACTVGCGPGDYRAPIQQFSDASAVVAASATTYLDHENTIEQDALVTRLAFEAKPIRMADVDRDAVVTPAEIALRAQAISTLSAYTANLAFLASGGAGSSIGHSVTNLSASLKKIAADASALQNPKIDNAKFSGMVGAAANAIGAVAQLAVDRRSRRDIESSVEQNEKPIEDLIGLIGEELTLSYERQKATLGAKQIYLAQAYAAEQSAPASDIAKRLALAAEINAYRRQVTLLQAADPAPAVQKMNASFVALVAYARSGKNPKTLAALWQSVQEFAATAQPLGQAIQSLIASTS